MKILVDQLVAKSKTAMTSKREQVDLARLRDGWETAHKSIDEVSALE